MTELRQGNIFEASAEALVNTVNTVGVMGKGVALQFKRAFPDNYKAYAAACKRGEVQVGKVFVHHRNTLENPRYIINFPTKRHWRGRSRLEYIRAGLEDLVDEARHLDVRSIALPPLGCGNGGLAWEEVLPLIEEASERLPEVEFLVYEPHTAKEPKTLAAREPKPGLTPVRAALLKLFAVYEALDGTIGRLEAQKLAYFLQSAGMDMRLNFAKQKYGPYTATLDHVLKRLEGYYFEGYGDLNTRSRIRLKQGVEEQADSFLSDYPDALQFLERTAHVIDGFETPYGMELLATVHWAVHHEEAENFDSVVEAVHDWSDRKKYAFTREHIRVAWEHLLDEGWAPVEPASDIQSDAGLPVSTE